MLKGWIQKLRMNFDTRRTVGGCCGGISQFFSEVNFTDMLA